ncbi:hypothetical protein GQX74_013620 [Glossina fuscipes]|nr:hypothetical protein GQX74_013620 [Glossina fuscipes]
MLHMSSPIRYVDDSADHHYMLIVFSNKHSVPFTIPLYISSSANSASISVRTSYSAYLWYAEEVGYQRAPKTIKKQIEHDQRRRESLRLEFEGFFGFEVIVLNKAIPIIDEVILDLTDMICEGETGAHEAGMPRKPEPCGGHLDQWK